MKGAISVLLLLALLKKNDSYGYQIAQNLNIYSSEQIKWNAASMYPILKKMESKKLIKSYWNIDDFDRLRKYYQILKNGIEELESNMNEMKLVTGIIEAILKSEN